MVTRPENTRRLLIYAFDREVAADIETACREASPATHCVVTTDRTAAVDRARDTEPIAFLLKLSGDADTDVSIISEMRGVAPEMMIVGIHENDERTFSSAYLVELLRIGCGDFLRYPLPQRELRMWFDRVADRAGATVAGGSDPSLGTVVAFVSNKGGVGKSTLSVNVATRLAMRYPDDVLLIDTSLQMGVCAPMLDLQPETTLLDVFEQRRRLDQTLIRQLAIPHASGLSVLAAPTDPVAASDIDDQAMMRVLNLARRTFSFVIVDTFPLLDQVILSVLDISSRAYVVLDNVVPTVLSGVQLMRLLGELQYPLSKIAPIINRHQRIAGNPSVEDCSRSLGVDVVHVVPFSKRAITSANLGRPFMMDWVKFSKLHRAVDGIVDEIVGLGTAPSMNPPPGRSAGDETNRLGRVVAPPEATHVLPSSGEDSP